MIVGNRAFDDRHRVGDKVPDAASVAEHAGGRVVPDCGAVNCQGAFPPGAGCDSASESGWGWGDGRRGCWIASTVVGDTVVGGVDDGDRRAVRAKVFGADPGGAKQSE